MKEETSNMSTPVWDALRAFGKTRRPEFLKDEHFGLTSEDQFKELTKKLVRLLNTIAPKSDEELIKKFKSLLMSFSEQMTENADTLTTDQRLAFINLIMKRAARTKIPGGLLTVKESMESFTNLHSCLFDVICVLNVNQDELLCESEISYTPYKLKSRKEFDKDEFRSAMYFCLRLCKPRKTEVYSDMSLTTAREIAQNIKQDIINDDTSEESFTNSVYAFESLIVYFMTSGFTKKSTCVSESIYNLNDRSKLKEFKQLSLELYDFIKDRQFNMKGVLKTYLMNLA